MSKNWMLALVMIAVGGLATGACSDLTGPTGDGDYEVGGAAVPIGDDADALHLRPDAPVRIADAPKATEE